MTKYIDADAFVKEKREWYCEQCLKRKGMKRGRLQFVYEIGDAPCRACYVDEVISDIEDLPAADVEPKRKSGRWVYGPDGLIHCSVCEQVPINRVCINRDGEDHLIYQVPLPITETMKWCPLCGAKMDKEAEDE